MIPALEKADRDLYLSRMAENLPLLRIKLNMTQEALCNIIGISRQTVVQAERNKKLSWNTYLSLVLIFLMDERTRELMLFLQIYPPEFQEALFCKKQFTLNEQEVQ